MKCVKCGSEKVNVSREIQSEYKQKHNVLWYAFISWWWLPCKWLFKWTGVLIYYVSIFPIQWIIAKIKKTTVKRPTFIKKRRGKLYQNAKVVCVCQNCGASWEIEE